MKNKKGFTLIELLAVIVILGVIITVASSNVVKYLKKSKEGINTQAAVEIIKIAESYFAAETNCDDDDSDPTNNCSVRVDTLANEGYLEDKITNPLDGKIVKSRDLSGHYVSASCGTPSPIATKGEYSYCVQ